MHTYPVSQNYYINKINYYTVINYIYFHNCYIVVHAETSGKSQHQRMPAVVSCRLSKRMTLYKYLINNDISFHGMSVFCLMSTAITSNTQTDPSIGDKLTMKDGLACCSNYYDCADLTTRMLRFVTCAFQKTCFISDSLHRTR